MGKASASKKIKRVQAAGVSRSPGQRRNMGFPVLVVAILLVGSVMTFFARDYRKGERADAPVVNNAQAQFFEAWGVNLCGAFEENKPTPDNADGFHIHSDLLIHIHPYVKSVSGKNATFGVFARNNGIKLGDGEFALPDGRTFKNGEPCKDESGKETKGRVALYVWPPQATDKTKPEVFTRDLDKVRFSEKGMAFVLSFNPEKATPKLPPTLENLKNPNNTDDSSSAPTDSTAPGDSVPAPTDSSVPEGATTSVPPTETAPPTTSKSAPTTAKSPTSTTKGN